MDSKSIEIESVKQYLDYKILHLISNEMGLTEVLGKYAKYILLLVYTQIISRKSIYRLPEYIEQTTLKELLGLVQLKNTKVYATDFDFMEGKLIAVYNPEIELIKRNHAIESGRFDSDKARYMGYSKRRL
ncbi:hypothetical protein DESAMIL20_844 [Desulfurella amilsii]|uniref:Uncharacterized protein n=1 Tax=Desulfurella amilsii TaxID=1562698 RepID=A0A1X4XUU1_9BACT|nr:hypothetical protein [Desulfurella amilsii]OSS41291.1 hypothetical protein DESAMIL20_844 [Desulfurella amilsii]